MIPKTRRATPSTALVPPGAALCFSLLMIGLAPRYATWFGALPKFTRNFFDDYPILIGISAIALTSVIIARQFPAFAE